MPRLDAPPLIFLDIDGVLNNPGCYDPSTESSTLFRPCILCLNRIVRETGAKIVLSSSWRYMIHGGEMSVAGFGYLLRTHGVISSAKVVGLTRTDEEIPLRGDQIAAWLRDHPGDRRYVVIDDDERAGSVQGQPSWNHPFVLTDGAVGLTDADADRAIAILKGEA